MGIHTIYSGTTVAGQRVGTTTPRFLPRLLLWLDAANIAAIPLK